jgi:uncharacterized membrane protein
MKPIPNYPIWLAAFMLLGPFGMIGGLLFSSQTLIWTCQVVGAAMVMIALFSLSKRLHEQSEEVSNLRGLVTEYTSKNGREPNPLS